MLSRIFNLIEGLLYRSPLRLMEAMKGEQKRSWDLGYHHAKRGHDSTPEEANDQEAYIKGYEGQKRSATLNWPHEPSYHTGTDEPREHLKLPDGANIPNYQLSENIKSGKGMQPGDFARVLHRVNYGEDGESDSYNRDNASYEAETLSKPMREYGQAFIDSDPELSSLWSYAMNSRGVHEDPDADLQGYQDRQQAAMAIVDKLSTLGKASIPEEHYERRKNSFQSSLIAKIEPSGDIPLSNLDMQRAEFYGGALFDAFGPAAEATLQRVVGTLQMQSFDDEARCFFDEHEGKITWEDKESLFHEFGHAMDTLFHGADTDDAGYWSSRVQGKDRSPAVRHYFGDDEEEVVKEDSWADPYMGKVYSHTSEWDHEEQVGSHSEVVPVFLEGISNFDAGGKWANQIKKDPQSVLEVIGYLRASIDGVREGGWGGG